ncbi:MAG: helix-turn-helix transcriptional regulator [Thermomicrobiales bacterium]|nr:helix-turn-helix transcriptional regulator [Thermomicrobiales bacterium]
MPDASLMMERIAYTEFSPPPHLRGHVVCLWHHAAGAEARETNVLPDGCVDIVWIADRPPFVAGPMTSAALHQTAAGTAITGIRFRPGVAPFLLGVGASDLRDRDVPLRDIWPAARHRLWQDAVAEVRLAAKLSAIDTALSAAIAGSRGEDPLVTWAARWLAAHPGATVEALVRLSGASERQLRRRFDAAVGYGPKTLQRILRLQRLLWLAGNTRDTRPELAALALAAGYADQPHMTRETRRLAGSSPRRLLLDATPASAVADLFKTAAP